MGPEQRTGTRRGTATALVTGAGVVLPGVKHAADLLAPEPLEGAGRVGPERLPSGRGARNKDRATMLAFAAATLALADAGLLDDEGLCVPGETVGTVVSSNLGNLDTVCRVAERLSRDGTAGISALDLPNASSNVIASSVAIRFGLRGANFTLCNGATSGLDAVGWATLAVETGRVARVLVIGVEPANAVVERLAGGDAPARLLDGSGALVLESSASAEARERGARAAVAGYARRRDLTTTVGVATNGRARVGLWLPPQGGARAERAPAGVGFGDVCDLGRTLPSASGALGVLQCAAATAWLADPGRHRDAEPTALAAAGGGATDDAAAAVLLTTT
ncbi:beta-ketoacyl synthase N-terminal-like domain-containing protein [Streptomyces sp. NPDC002928]|uniref:beta-ketoacyl synthase N-terminal-like domain-containing protein n=1 Tax=Streptomyces sp. NPDC002928 TaxID=3154440 RepID=UPI0033ABD21B